MEESSFRFVVFFRPGVLWRETVAYHEQRGIFEHITYLRNLRDVGILSQAGAFPAGIGGGMVITMPGLSRQQVEPLIQNDPAVQSNLLRYEIIPWQITVE